MTLAAYMLAAGVLTDIALALGAVTLVRAAIKRRRSHAAR